MGMYFRIWRRPVPSLPLARQGPLGPLSKSDYFHLATKLAARLQGKSGTPDANMAGGSKAARE